VKRKAGTFFLRIFGIKLLCFSETLMYMSFEIKKIKYCFCWNSLNLLQNLCPFFTAEGPEMLSAPVVLENQSWGPIFT
jgi:hypothetical protein